MSDERVARGSGGDAPRSIHVLIEHHHGLVRLDLEEELTAAGFEVTSCAGPQGAQHPCPLLVGEACELAAEADVILNALGPDQMQIYTAQRSRLPRIPVVLDVGDQDAQHLDGVLTDVHRAGPIPHGTALVARLHEAVQEARARSDG